MSAQTRATYNALVESQNQRITQIPAAAAGFNLISDNAAVANAYMAANVVIVAVGTVPVLSHLLGITLGIPVVEAFQADIIIAIGNAPEVTLVTIGVGTNVFPVAEWSYPTIWFGGSGIRLNGQPRLSYNIRKSTGGSFAGFNICHLVIKTNIGA